MRKEEQHRINSTLAIHFHFDLFDPSNEEPNRSEDQGEQNLDQDFISNEFASYTLNWFIQISKELEKMRLKRKEETKEI